MKFVARALSTERGRLLAVAILLVLLSAVFLRQALLLPPELVLGEGYDMRGMFYVWMETAKEALSAGRLPLWDPYQFAGYPFLSNPQVGFFYPPTWLIFLLPTQIGISWYVLLHLWLMGMGMALFVRRMGSNWMGVLLASVAFAFSGYASVRIWGGHTAVLATNAWLPWLLWAFAAAVRGGWQRAVLAGVPLALAILGGHISSLLYVGLAWAAFCVYALAAEARARIVIPRAMIAAGVGLALAAVQLLPLFQFALGSTRVTGASLDFAAGFSLPPAHLATLVMPEFFGEPTRVGYWSVPNFVELTYYAGIPPLLALLLLPRRPTKLSWFYIGLTCLGLLLALGSYGFLFELFYDLLPPFRLARAPGRAAFLYTFAAAAALGHLVGGQPFGSGKPDGDVAMVPYWRRMLLGMAVVGVAGIGATAAAFAAQHPTETSGRLWHQIGGWAWALLLALVSGVLLWHVIAAGRATTRHRLLGGGLLLLLLADLWGFGAKFVWIEPMAVDPIWQDAKAIVGDTDQRVLPWGVSIFAQNGASLVGLRSVFGYNALEPAALTGLAGSVPDPRSTAYDVLGVRYVIAPGPQDQYLDGDRPLRLIGQQGAAWVYERARVLPLARLASEAETLPDRGAAIARIHAPGFDPTETVILDDSPDCDPGSLASGQGNVTVLEQSPGVWRLQVDTPAPTMLVLSETSYPGWRVTVDGERARRLTAYTALQAVCVPDGSHEIVWTYRPVTLLWGGLLSIVMVLACLGAAWSVRGRSVPLGHDNPENEIGDQPRQPTG